MIIFSESMKKARRWIEIKFVSTVWSTGVLDCVQARKESLISILPHSQLFTATTVLDERTNLNKGIRDAGSTADFRML